MIAKLEWTQNKACITFLKINGSGQDRYRGKLLSLKIKGEVGAPLNLFKPSNKWRILGECLLISSLQGRALRTRVDIARLAERFNMRSQSGAW